MKILAIDIGSYAVKFFEVTLEKKVFFFESSHHVIIDQVISEYNDEISLLEIQQHIIADYLDNIKFQGKIIYQLNHNLITSRYLEIPVNNKKKAELMIPFQLEENLPYQINQIHFTSSLRKNNDHTDALINITQKDLFNDYYKNLEQLDIFPHKLISETSIVQNFVNQNQIGEASCILDIGHETTKAYFISNGNIVSNHISYVAGKLINEIISQTYQIDLDDSVIYKHENCFFLNEEQFDEVDNDQVEFAKLMKQVFWPLILDIRRWELGFRVKHADSISKIYLMGGSSSIKNIESFFADHLSVEVRQLNILNNLKEDEVKINTQDRNLYGLSFMMSSTYLSKEPIPSFLSNEYSRNSDESVSLYSTSFMFTRTIALSLLIILALTGERFFYLNKEIKTVDKTIKTLLKKPSLNLSKKEIRNYKKKPDQVYKKITKIKNRLTKEIQIITPLSATDAIIPLVQLSKVLPANKNINLVSFESSNNLTTAVFESQNIKDLNFLKSSIESSTIKNNEVEFDEKRKKLTLRFED